MINVLLVMFGGGLGAVVRAWLTDYAKERWTSTLPIATLVVNIIGSFLIGLVLGLCIHLQWFSLFFVTGFLGGLTTFSTMSYELVNFLSPNFKPVQFIAYSCLQFIIGFLACYLGFII